MEEWKVVLVTVSFAAWLHFAVAMYWRLRQIWKAKKRLEKLDYQTWAEMQQAFRETRQWQADIQSAIDEQGIGSTK